MSSIQSSRSVAGREGVAARDVANRFHMHVEVIRRWARSGKIPSFRTGRVWRFDLDAVEAALRSRSNA